MENLLNDKQDSVRWLTLNRPERRNALDRDTIYALKAGLAESARDADTRLVVLTGGRRGVFLGCGFTGRSLAADDSRRRADRGRLQRRDSNDLEST